VGQQRGGLVRTLIQNKKTKTKQKHNQKKTKKKKTQNRNNQKHKNRRKVRDRHKRFISSTSRAGDYWEGHGTQKKMGESKEVTAQ